jgi:hypothetical protein
MIGEGDLFREAAALLSLVLSGLQRQLGVERGFNGPKPAAWAARKRSAPCDVCRSRSALRLPNGHSWQLSGLPPACFGPVWSGAVGTLNHLIR